MSVCCVFEFDKVICMIRCVVMCTLQSVKRAGQCTFTLDSSEDVCSDPIVHVMVHVTTVSGGNESYLFKQFALTSERHTAQALYDQLLSVLRQLRELQCDARMFVSDNEATMKALSKILWQ